MSPWVQRSLVVVALFLGASPLAAALDITAGPLSGFVIERGPVSARASPCFGALIGCGFAAPGGSVEVETSFTTGALLGQVLAVGAVGSYQWDARGTWRPRLGLEVACDFGDVIFASAESLSAPPTPQVFVGGRLEPLRFVMGPWDLSWLELGVLTGSGSWFSEVRLEVTLMSLAYRWEW